MKCNPRHGQPCIDDVCHSMGSCAWPPAAPIGTVSTRKVGNFYKGVLRDGKTIVWECGHLHRNRDMSPGIRQSARDCALAYARAGVPQ
jgi:hypothetical protein